MCIHVWGGDINGAPNMVSCHMKALMVANNLISWSLKYILQDIHLLETYWTYHIAQNIGGLLS